MKLKITIFILISILFSISPFLTGQTFAQNGEKIVFLSDTQSPIWIEKFYLDYNDNEQARDLLSRDIINQSPSAVFHLGDLVSFGFDNDDWEFIDNFTRDLRNLQIPFYPAIGNHELLNLPLEGEANFVQRFPDFIKTGYTKIIGSTAIILLNSNFDHLSDILIKKQQEWFKNELSNLDHDASINNVIVGCHHPPFTNSSMVSSSEEVQEQFVSQFSRYDKCRLFITGHAHRIEHFRIDGKDYVVAGGGGGMQHPANSDEITFYDHFPSGSDPRPFHYVSLSMGEVIEVLVRAVSPEGDFLKNAYSFLIEPKRKTIIAKTRDGKLGK